jgi:hypothetical protein
MGDTDQHVFQIVEGLEIDQLAALYARNTEAIEANAQVRSTNTAGKESVRGGCLKKRSSMRTANPKQRDRFFTIVLTLFVVHAREGSED